MSIFCPDDNAGCASHNKYDHSKSQTYVKTDKVYNHTTYSGFYSVDDMNIAGVKIRQQMFVEMTDVPNSYARNKADGAMGMSLPYGDQKNFIMHMLEQKFIKKPIFAIYMNRDKSSVRGGRITVGYYEQKRIHQNDNLTYIQATGEYGLWEFSIDGVALNNGTHAFPLCNTGCKAFLDTSTNAIVTSQHTLDVINDHIKAKAYKYDRFVVDCDSVLKLPKMDIVINGKNFTLSGKHYIQKVKEPNSSAQVCLSAFMASTLDIEVNRWMLGGAFLSHFYTIYDMEKKEIGIVTAA